MPDPETLVDETAMVPHDAVPAWRRRAMWAGLAALIVVSAVVLVRAPRAADSQAAMGQGLPSTAPGQIVEPELRALAVGFLPDGFTLVFEESDGVDRVVQRYVRDVGQVITVTSVLGSFNPDRALENRDDAEAVDVGGVTGVLQRGANEATGAEELSVRLPVGDGYNVIVRGIGGVSPADVLAVAASIEP